MLKYNKPKTGRIHSGSGPRDLQRRGSTSTDSSSDHLVSLITQVTSLTSELAELKREGLKASPASIVSGDKLYTEAEFNEELIKALEDELAKSPLTTELDTLKSEVKHLKDIILSKDDIISALKRVSLEGALDTPEEVSDRPVISEEVIDPTDTSNIRIEPHIDIKEVKESNTSAKLSKLKNILGG